MSVARGETEPVRQSGMLTGGLAVWPRLRPVVAAVGALAVAMAVVLVAKGAQAAPPAGAGPSAWTTLQGAADRNPVVPVSGARAASLAASWRLPTGGSIVAAPAIVRGVAYFGSMDHRVYAVNVASGREIWSFQADNQVMSEPLVVGGRVFFSSGNKGYTGTGAARVRGTGPSALYALDARSGRLLWTFPTVGEAMPTPAYAGGVLYEPTGGGYFYAVDAATGRLLWKLHEGAVTSMSSPAIAGGLAVFGGVWAGAPSFYAVDLQTHRIRWTVPIPGAWGGPDDLSPSVVGGIAYLQVPEGSSTQTVMELAVRLSTGLLVWQRTLGAGAPNYHGGEEAGVTSVAGGVAYVGSPVLHGLWALSAATGQTIWHSPLPVSVRAAPAVTEHHVYAVSAGRLYALNRASGALEGYLRIGQRPAESDANYLAIPCASPAPVVVGKTLLVAGGAQNVLVALPLARLLHAAPPPVAR